MLARVFILASALYLLGDAEAAKAPTKVPECAEGVTKLAEDLLSACQSGAPLQLGNGYFIVCRKGVAI